MAIINIIITDKRPTVEGSPVIVCGNSDYTLSFSFDGAWSDTSAKTARFVYIQDGEVKYQDVTFKGTTVAVPTLSNIKEVRVGVYSGNLQTSTPAVIPCEYSIRCGTAAPTDPTSSQYDQIIALLEQNNAALAGIQVGGRNLLRGATTLEGNTLGSGITRAEDIEGYYVAHFSAAESLSWRSVSFRSPILPLSEILGKTITLSFEVRSDDFAAINAAADQGVSLTLAATESTSSVTRLRSRDVNLRASVGLTAEWQKVVRTYAITSNFFNTGDGALTDSAGFLPYFYFYSTYSGELRKFKIELGNTATDWTPSPVDIEARAASLEERVAALEASLLAMGGEI